MFFAWLKQIQSYVLLLLEDIFFALHFDKTGHALLGLPDDVFIHPSQPLVQPHLRANLGADFRRYGLRNLKARSSKLIFIRRRPRKSPALLGFVMALSILAAQRIRAAQSTAICLHVLWSEAALRNSLTS